MVEGILTGEQAVIAASAAAATAAAAVAAAALLLKPPALSVYTHMRFRELPHTNVSTNHVV